MVEPRQGDRAHGRGFVKVLAGPKALVFGIRCDDPEPAGIVSFTKERDGDFESEDHVVVVLDPFLDGRSGYVFAVNPGGARYDALVAARWRGRGQELGRRVGGRHRPGLRRLDGGDPHPDRDPELPGRPPRLGPERPAAGPAAAGDGPLGEPAAGLLDLPDEPGGPAHRASPLRSRPGPRRAPRSRRGFQNPAPETPTDGTLEPSLDVTQRLGTNALASLTVNTDFAETEVDAQQTNLTRFPLFFPEKRTFFLDGADIFDVRGRPRRREPAALLQPPHRARRRGRRSRSSPASRRRAASGQTNFGGLVVRTREEPGVAPASTMAVVRVKQNVFAESRRRLHRDARRSARSQRELGSRSGLHLPDVAPPRRQELQRGRVGPRHGAQRPRPVRRQDGARAQGRLPERPVGLRLQLPAHRRRLRPVAGVRSPARNQQLPARLHVRAAPAGHVHPADVPRVRAELDHRPRRALGELSGLHGPGELAARERRPLRAQRRTRRASSSKEPFEIVEAS